MDLANIDPWFYSVDQVIQVLCHSTHLWNNVPKSTLPDLYTLETSLRDNDMVGWILLSAVDRTVLKDVFGITSFGKQQALMHVIDQLRSRSEGYASHIGHRANDLADPQTLTPTPSLIRAPPTLAPSHQFKKQAAQEAPSSSLSNRSTTKGTRTKSLETSRRVRLVTPTPAVDSDDFAFDNRSRRPYEDLVQQPAKYQNTTEALTGVRSNMRTSASEWDDLTISHPAKTLASDPGILIKDLGSPTEDADDASSSSDDDDMSMCSQQEPSKGLSKGVIMETIDEAIARYKGMWHEKNRQGLGSRALKLWNESRGRNLASTIDRDSYQLEKFRRTLARGRAHIQSDEWTSTQQLDRMCATLQVMVQNVEEYEWRLSIYNLFIAPDSETTKPHQGGGSKIREPLKQPNRALDLIADVDDPGNDVGDLSGFGGIEEVAGTGGTGDNKVKDIILKTCLNADFEWAQQMSRFKPNEKQVEMTMDEVAAANIDSLLEEEHRQGLLFKLLMSLSPKIRSEIAAVFGTYHSHGLVEVIDRRLVEHINGEPFPDKPNEFDMLTVLYLCWHQCLDCYINRKFVYLPYDETPELARQDIQAKGLNFMGLIENMSVELSQHPLLIKQDYYVDEDFKSPGMGQIGVMPVYSKSSKMMKEHQREGVRFLWRELILGDGPELGRGCLLSHTMGLGKTMQTITFIVSLLHAAAEEDHVKKLPPRFQHGSRRKPRIVVVCPSGLTDNWQEEFCTWAPPDFLKDTFFVVIDETKPMRVVEDKVRTWVSSGGIVIVTYDQLVKLKSYPDENGFTPFCDLSSGADLVVADEVHKAKNAATGFSRSVHELRTPFRIALTGSPIANNLLEYQALLNWAVPSLLERNDIFRAKFQRPIELGLRADATEAQRNDYYKALKELNKLIGHKVHRRGEWTLSWELPEKFEFVIKLRLLPSQKQVYGQLLESVHIKSAMPDKPIKSGKPCGSVLGHHIFGYLNALTAVNFHLLAFKNAMDYISYEHSAGKARPEERDPLEDGNLDVPAASKDSLSESTKALLSQPSEQAIRASAKPYVIAKILEASLAAGDCVVIFSQWTAILSCLEHWLQGAYPNRVARLDGKTKPAERQALTRRISRDDVSILLCSTRLGGQGLNMQGANRVIIADFGFNPVLEQQAVGRAWRLGQRKLVYVYHLVVDGTFEAQLHERTIFKRELALQVVDGIDQPQSARSLESLLDPPSNVESQPLDGWLGKDKVLDAVIRAEDAPRHVTSIGFMGGSIDTETETWEDVEQSAEYERHGASAAYKIKDRKMRNREEEKRMRKLCEDEDREEEERLRVLRDDREQDDAERVLEHQRRRTSEAYMRKFEKNRNREEEDQDMLDF